MKGTVFQKPFEFNLLVEGETWHQGDPISGTLVIRNRGSEPVSPAGIHVSLARGEYKKVRAKAPDAFTVLASVPMDGSKSLVPQSEERFSWKFETDRNCPISDTGGSLFLIYGQGDATEKLGQLQLPIVPYWVIQEFLKVIEIDFRFVRKGEKSSKGFTEVKFAPPSAKAYAAVEQLSLLFRFIDETFEIKYVFSVKRIDATSGSMDLKKAKKEVQQSFAKHEYLIPSGRFNHGKMETAIRDALSQAGLGVLG